MLEKSRIYGKEKGNIMVAKTFEDFFKVKKDKKINKKERRIDQDVKHIRSIEEAEEWDEIDEEVEKEINIR
jgi:hypothetical protein|tara:strand:- start:548 stop:760 length:213 start_codon:yes stop_codon:yes gene_type:complete